MQLSKESTEANLVRAWEPGRIRIGERWIAGSFIVSAEHIVEWAAPEPESLALADLDAAIGLDPEVIIVGTGTKSVLPNVELMAGLAERGIGLEIMTTAAACRTYNVLVHEQRRVVAALLNP